MPEDDKQEEQEEATEDTEAEEESEAQESEEERKDEGEDYRGKLNATNNFLKKEGYEWDKDTKQWVKPAKASEKKAAAKDKGIQLSPKDALMLAKADIALEDVDEVVDFANYRKITVADALANPTLKAILADRVEERKTAAATNSRGGQSAKKMTGDKLIEQASKGVLSDKDDDIAALVAAEMESKRKRVSK